MKSASFISTSFCLLLCVLAPFTGCNSFDANSPNQQASDQREVYGKTLNKHSSPTNLAEVALIAIQKNDLETLTSLVAVDRVTKDLASITQGKSQFSKWTEKGAETSAKAISNSFQHLVQPVALGAETIHGDQATVVVSSADAGQLHERTFHFCREQGWWKLVPSHR